MSFFNEICDSEDFIKTTSENVTFSRINNSKVMFPHSKNEKMTMFSIFRFMMEQLNK